MDAFPDIGPALPPGANGHSKTNGSDWEKPIPPLLSAAEFMATFTNPIYLIDGIIQRGRVHSLTSITGHGKTAVALFLACLIATGRNLGNIEVVQGDVVFLAGENPDDLCGRFHAACQLYNVDPLNLPIRVMPGNFPMTGETAEALKQQLDTAGRPIALIIGDSAAAYFPGDDDNHNVQMGAFARNLRVLTGCAGNPAVLILCHPVKAAAKDNLVPRGGGAFLNEVDAGLTLWAEAQGETTTLHWQGKIRGADFQPVNFTLKQVKLENMQDAKGRRFVSIVATLQSEEQSEKAIGQAAQDENTVLEHLRRTPGISIANVAANAGWVSETGVPNKAKVHRLLKSLAKDKLAKFWRGKWQITTAGEAELSGKSGRKTDESF
jgi:RecA-family ATPase